MGGDGIEHCVPHGGRTKYSRYASIQDPTIRTSQAAALWSRPHSDFIEPMQALADSSGDAPDDLDFRLIVLGILNTCSKER